ncbi:zinc finger protein, putative [Babesia bigemina]|uniref:Zinc finger protein, putative n=1 Tax=Babesia bigemina TaxID=5866 RepID=A0A061D192_BABBI|nr:zinc finger protein, putative [Babesia bigemina]CDR94403.1 zinc finger protein, putative [Babesia bigemina]|eukprot:XP_012766589.1 zinc finger protein, putative [Babesia bigemina]
MFQKRNLAALRNRTPVPQPEAAASGASHDGATTAVRLAERRTGRKICVGSTKDAAATVRADVGTYEPDRSEEVKSDQRATSTYEIDTEASRDHRSILERNAEIGRKLLNEELEDGVYRGRGAYRPVMNIREGSIAASKYTGLYGPVRASSTNVRTTLRIDYQPDVCKDYKETGYCGFGDSCKFLHDRSDYKSGWQLENEWEQAQSAKRQKLQEKLARWQRKVQKNLADPEAASSGSDAGHAASDAESGSSCDSSSSDDDSDSDSAPAEKSKYARALKARARNLNIPFSCLACRKAWRPEMNPIVTTCGHYFCESCAIRSYSRNMKCAKCGVSQDGILNPAQAVIKLLASMNSECE